MHETMPEVFLIARPMMNWKEVDKYLMTVDPRAMQWANRMGRVQVSDAEALTEFGGRLCYRSWSEGLNANVTKIRKDSETYLGNILSSRHGSVLEHAQFSFVFHNVSRVFTHELVRHRVGIAISQESLRYVRLTHLGFRVPDVLDPIRNEVIEMVERLEEFQIDAAKQLGLDDDGVPFHIKKEITSALRRLAPIGLSTGMLWSANLRTLRFCLEARTAPGAEEEIRLVFDQVGKIMKRECSLIFQDFERHDDGTWVPEHSKV